MVKSFRKPFSLAGLWVSNHEKAGDFFLSSWQRGESVAPMLAVRLVLFSFALGILVWSLVEAPNPYWLIYLTNWGLLLVTMMTLTGLITCIMAATRNISPDSSEIPWYVSMYWFLFNVTTPLAFVITLLYWVLLFNPELADTSERAFWLDVMSHGCNSLVVVTELLVSRTPMRLAHIYQPLGAGLWYAAFTGIYYLAGGTDSMGNPFIYAILDWSEGAEAGAVVGASVAGLILVYLVLWGLTIGRDRLATTFVRGKSHDLPFTPSEDSQSRIV